MRKNLLYIFLILVLSICVIHCRGSNASATTIVPPPTDQATVPQTDPVAVAQQAVPTPKIPDKEVSIYIRNGSESRFELFFVDAGYDLDVVDFEYYKAWCLEKGKRIRRNAMHEIRAYNCYDPNLPDRFKNADWDRINYIINHKRGSKSDVQQAIWYILGQEKKGKISKEAMELVEEAMEKGRDYRPGEGELIAVIIAPAKQQAVAIELPVPKAETFDTAPAFFAPEALPVGSSFHFFPFFPPIFPPDHPEPPPPPPPPPPTPEASTMLLIGTGLAFTWMTRRVWTKVG